MGQIKAVLHIYPWLPYVAVSICVIGMISSIAILAVWQWRVKRQVVPFEELKEYPPSKTSSDLSQTLIPDDDDYTRILVNEDAKLKSYRLELRDLNLLGKCFAVPVQERIVIGRRQTCDITIANSTLSGEHCEIVLKNGKLYLHDLNSLNGTYVNGNQKKVNEELLTNGDVIEIGSERLQLAVVEI